MAARRLRPVHPGDILTHDFMEPLGLSSRKLAKILRVSVPSVDGIVRRRRPVTAQMAIRLSRYFGATVRLWQNLPNAYDLEIAGTERIALAPTTHAKDSTVDRLMASRHREHADDFTR